MILLILFLKFIFPKDFFENNIVLFQNIRNQLPYLLLIFGVVGFHLFEVNVIDPITTDWVGYNYATTIQSIEGDIVYWFSQHWTPALVYFFVLMYIVVYPFTLWFAPLYFLLLDEKRSMKNLAYGLLLVYIVVLPFYLFLPIENVYKFYNVKSALETVIPNVENFFYTTTTQNNCLPSLHTTMTIIIAYTISLTGNKRFTYFAYFVMISVILSVIYLSIHWITDVLTGVLLAGGVIYLLKRYIKE